MFDLMQKADHYWIFLIVSVVFISLAVILAITLVIIIVCCVRARREKRSDQES